MLVLLQIPAQRSRNWILMGMLGLKQAETSCGHIRHFEEPNKWRQTVMLGQKQAETSYGHFRHLVWGHFMTNRHVWPERNRDILRPFQAFCICGPLKDKHRHVWPETSRDILWPFQAFCICGPLKDKQASLA